MLVEIRFHGRAGQGMVTAAELLASAAGAEGKYSQAFPVFGSEKRGPPVMSFCRISDSPITIYDQVSEPDIVVVADPSVLSSVNVAAGLKKGGIIIANCNCNACDLGFCDAKVYAVDGTKIALEHLKKPIFNTVMLGAFIKITGLVKMESIETAINDEFGEKDKAIAAKNIEVIRACYELTKKE
jgi:2-oxoacid:acceptor oxidoreductase gamma subunit (pyruvate/2-ketoisovalerate family)